MYKKALYPIHIFQNNIRENNSIQNEIFEKIHYMKSKKKIDLDIPEGWTTYKLYTSFKYEDLNMEMFGLIAMNVENGRKNMHTQENMYFNSRHHFLVFTS